MRSCEYAFIWWDLARQRNSPVILSCIIPRIISYFYFPPLTYEVVFRQSHVFHEWPVELIITYIVYGCKIVNIHPMVKSIASPDANYERNIIHVPYLFLQNMIFFSNIYRYLVNLLVCSDKIIHVLLNVAGDEFLRMKGNNDSIFVCKLT